MTSTLILFEEYHQWNIAAAEQVIYQVKDSTSFSAMMEFPALKIIFTSIFPD
jgi:hypothetical protein